MNYYQIAPLSYLGRETSLLTYSSEETLIIGQAVLIPLREKSVIGLVLDKTLKPKFKTKEITKVIFDHPIINKSLLETAFWISDYYCASITSVLQTIIPKGLAVKRRAISSNIAPLPTDSKPTLTVDQKKVINDILSNHSGKPNLIFGVTGSGKTEIYMRLIEKTLLEKKAAIVLVPEVSLTPQALDRFQARFGKEVTILHSYLKETERFANWQSILEGEKSIVVGSRSALFAPLVNLGLIIVDEEHENSYKQDQTPRYQTVKVAEKLAILSKATLVLGSATPSIESFYQTQIGHYKLHTLNKRIVQVSLPKVEVVDMRNEFKFGNKSIFSEKLVERIQETLSKKQQILLFINRRGMSTFVNCRDCGYVANCPNCNLPLTFHYKPLRLVCHHCHYKEGLPILCPSCKSASIKYFGTGTQRVEEELKKLINNQYIIERMDRDTTKKSGSHDFLYNNFAQHKIDVLIGTQMITKGWDFDNLGLVGIISADTMINFPDYNASERTFDLLTQVAGRTGRGRNSGSVVLQTYNTDNPAIIYASKHDYLGFYNTEIKERQILNYPPFAQLIKLMYNDSVYEKAELQANLLAKKISSELGKTILTILGPSPAFIPKLANKYRWQITLKIPILPKEEMLAITHKINLLVDNKWSMDVDPNGII